MSKVAIYEAVYDAMIERGLNPEHEAFEDMLNACCEVAQEEHPGEVDVLGWVVYKETQVGIDRLFSENGVTPRTATQVYLDWRAYLDKCGKKTVKLTALLGVLVEVGAAHAD